MDILLREDLLEEIYWMNKQVPRPILLNSRVLYGLIGIVSLIHFFVIILNFFMWGSCLMCKGSMLNSLVPLWTKPSLEILNLNFIGLIAEVDLGPPS